MRGENCTINTVFLHFRVVVSLVVWLYDSAIKSHAVLNQQSTAWRRHVAMSL